MKTLRRGNLSQGFAAALKGDWRMQARPAQLPPLEYSIWCLIAGRGSGKNWALSHLIHEQGATGAAKRVALIGATADAVRFTMVEGQAGVLAAAGAWERPDFESGKGQLTWPSGSIARLYSADSPELLRGPEHDLAWCDELASWRRAQETWDNLILTMRLGKNPRIVISTTPKPTKLIKDLVQREGTDGIVISRSTTYDNRANLPPSFFAQLVKKYEGTRTGRQELMAELLLDVPGALWSHAILEETRTTSTPQMQRVVVAIDPSGSGNEGADEAGIIVAGLGMDGEGYVLSDLSGRMSPPEWARKAIDAYRYHKADRIVAEINFGAQMVLGTLAAVDPNVPTKAITSSRGKVLRAEPISTIFEQRRAHLVGSFPELEDELTSFTSDYDRSRDGSPNRVDALVFALTELLCNQPVGGLFSESSLLTDGQPVDLPKCIDYVLAVAAVPTKAVGQVGVVFFSVCQSGVSFPLTILDWDVWPTDGTLFDEQLPTVFSRLESFACECRARLGSAGLWAQSSSGVCAAMLQQGIEKGHSVVDIDQHTSLPLTLADRAQAALRHICTGKTVKITSTAREKHQTLSGVTRNHLLAQFQAFRAAEELESDELLNAMCHGVILSLEDHSSFLQ